ncbi:MAG TPA: ABC transporter ATP-binding protein [Humisphaera sp.]|jgi:simple sugar transport system ATP-binding protein|nr:ABC transporter ATP-binding protein [Humisphaera sp.]
MSTAAIPIDIPQTPRQVIAPSLSATGVTKRFGSLLALDDVSMTVRPGTMHALLGGNGAGKSTLVKCIMGYYLPDEGQIALGGKPVIIRNPREALRLGIGMVYQHFTLVPNMTVAENLVLSRGKVPAIIDWKKEYEDLRAFMRTTPFFIPIGAKVSSLAAGQKQKLEICKQLYLKNKVLFLDEPTSVLTPGEADELLTMLKERTQTGDLTVLMITHKFREVMKFADDVTVLRTGRLAGKGLVKELTPADMSAMMIGSETTRTAARGDAARGKALLRIEGIHALDDIGLKALEDLNLEVHAGEIVGIAGVSGNGQSKLVEVLAGQRSATQGQVRVHDEPYFGSRAEIRRHRVNCLPEEPLKNTCIGNMSVAQNMVLRNFDQHPHAIMRFFLNKGSIRRAAETLIHRYRVKTPGPETQIRDLSGGNVQRAVLARELSGDVEVLIAANPCFGLDFAAAAEIRAQIIEARNRGAAVLLVSEDLDEIFELSDRIIVMFHGKFVYETTAAEADIAIIGKHMAGHSEHGDGHEADRN